MTKSDPRIRVDADFLFEVDPKSQVFDVVRERVNDAIADQYADLIVVDDLRSAVRTNQVELTPDSWLVDGTVDNGDTELHVDLVLPADGEAEVVLTQYIEDEVDDRFGIDGSRLRYKKVRLCAGAWFVDAVYGGD